MDREPKHSKPHEYAIQLEKVMEAKAKTITDICYDCLERIFDFLDLESLLNVAQTCKRLQNAAATKFSGAYGRTPVHLISGCRCKSIESRIYKCSSSILVFGMKLNLQFLRCFGEKISHLVEYHIHLNHFDHLDQYINQYCVHNLSTFVRHTIDKSKILNKNFIKPFENLTKLEINNGKLGNHSPNLDQLFPNLRTLRLAYVEIDVTAITAVLFPFLEDLHIKGCKNDGTQSKQSAFKNVVSPLLQACPFLKTLTIDARKGTTLDELLNMIIENKSILNLTVESEVENVDELDLWRLANEHPLLETLKLCHQTFTAEAAIILTQELEHLKEFKFQVDNRAEYHRLCNKLSAIWKTLYGDGNVTLSR